MRSSVNGWRVHWPGVEQVSNDTAAHLRSWQAYQMDNKKWFDIAYSFAVDMAGEIWELRGWGVAGSHTKHFNSTAHGLLFAVGSAQEVTQAQVDSALWLIRAGTRLGHNALPVLPHRATGNTECPGDWLTGWCKSVNNRPAGFVAQWQERIGVKVDDDFGHGTLEASVRVANQLDAVKDTICR